MRKIVFLALPALTFVAAAALSPAALAQGSCQQRIDGAISQAERVCLSGDLYKFKLDVTGNLQVLRIAPGITTHVDVDRTHVRGGTFFEDPKVKDLVDDKIRTCMERQWPAIAKFICEEKAFSESGPDVDFGCEAGNRSEITFHAPPGYRIVNAHVGVENADNFKYNTPSIAFDPNVDPHKARASVYFHGKDRVFFDCKSGGRGRARIFGTIVEE